MGGFDIEPLRMHYASRIATLKERLRAAVHTSSEKQQEANARVHRPGTLTAFEWGEHFELKTRVETFDTCYLKLFSLAADGADPIAALNAFQQYVAENVYRRAINLESRAEPSDKRELGAYARVLKMVYET
jgi:hypothetical protein